MSKYNNVNPGQYKVGGRERQGEEVVHDDVPTIETKTPNRRNAEKQNFIPGAAPVGEHDGRNDLRSRPEWDEPRRADASDREPEESKPAGGLFSRILSRFGRD